MTYFLQHNKTGKYVSLPGSERSYTSDIFQAQPFRTAEEAEKDSCVNSEHVIEVTLGRAYL